MASPDFDSDYVEEVIDRLNELPANATPAWGNMNRDALIHHLIGIVRYSMGKRGVIELDAPWLFRRVIGPWLVGPLIINGWLPMPKNVKGFQSGRAEGDLETLHAVLEEYLGLVQADEFTPARHPVFGDIGVDGWAKLHVVHFEHHLTQFGV